MWGLEGEERVRHYAVADAKYHATAFCDRCGSKLPWRPQGGKIIVVPAGTLDDSPGIQPVQNIFYASRAGWFVPSGDLPSHDELPQK